MIGELDHAAYYGGSGRNEEEEKEEEEEAVEIRRQMTVMAKRLFSERAADEDAEEPHEGEDNDDDKGERNDGEFDVGEAFRKEARCFGLLFKTCQMERVYLDGHARLHKHLVYLGYLVVLCADFFEFIFFYFFYLYLQAANEPGSKYESVDSVCDAVPAEASKEELFLSANDLTLKFLLPFYGSCWIVGSALQFTIHKWSVCKEKSWAILVTWVIYLIMVLFSSLAITSEDKICWPAELQPFIFLILPVFSFFSGAPSFTASLTLFVLSVLLYGLEFPISKRWLNEMYESSPGDTNEEAREDKLVMMTQFIDSTYFIVVLVVIYLFSLYPQEIESRKQFLQRMLMHNQQRQIIKEKTRNENLQRKLLESMLPTHIVNQLQRLDFMVSSWDQLRGLSHRHFGVSILFAELDGFAAFSSEVPPPSVMSYLNDLFLVFDNLCDRFDVYKVEVVRDQYVAAVGVFSGKMHKRKVSAGDVKLADLDARSHDSVGSLRESSASNTKAAVEFGMAIIREARRVVAPREAKTCPSVRVGIHTGDCISGLVGTRNFRFCLFGDTMNTAARMEQHSLPGHIHATQDVVALAPGYPWEAQDQMEVKGKGSMKTFLLRVQGLNSSAEGAEHGDGGVDKSASSLPDEYVNPLLVHEEQQLSWADLMLSPPSGGETTACRDALPVTLEMYISHTRCFGLIFKKSGLEVEYMNGEAMRHKHVTYLGYGLFVLVLLSNLAFGYIFGTWQLIICSQVQTSAQFCIETFSEDAYVIIQEYPDWRHFVDYEFLVTFAKFRMTPVCALLISVLVFLGVLSHWWIHQSKRFRMKLWALFVVFFFYYLLMIIMLLFALVFARLGHESAQWPHAINFTVMILSTLLIFFTGCPFVLYLIFWMTATALYTGLGYYVVRSDLKWVREGYTTPVITTQHFILRTVQVLFWQGVVLLIGSFLRDVTNRKRFLQRILMVEQHNEIINEKNKHTRIQQNFLESILPNRIVGRVKDLQQEENCKALKKSIRSISQSHEAVSILYADLVGFTSFSARVDPYKVMVFLNELFETFDGLCDRHNAYKLETIGDCYVCTVGVVTGEQVGNQLDMSLLSSISIGEGDENLGISQGKAEGSRQKWMKHGCEENNSVARLASASNSADLVNFAKAMLMGSRKVLKPELNTPATVRIGIHSGQCISGIVGTKNMKFCCFGETVEIAALMEKLGMPDCIHASEDVQVSVPEEPWERCKILNQRGGQTLQTYVLRVK